MVRRPRLYCCPDLGTPAQPPFAMLFSPKRPTLFARHHSCHASPGSWAGGRAAAGGGVCHGAAAGRCAAVVAASPTMTRLPCPHASPAPQQLRDVRLVGAVHAREDVRRRVRYCAACGQSGAHARVRVEVTVGAAVGVGGWPSLQTQTWAWKLVCTRTGGCTRWGRTSERQRGQRSRRAPNPSSVWNCWVASTFKTGTPATGAATRSTGAISRSLSPVSSAVWISLRLLYVQAATASGHKTRGGGGSCRERGTRRSGAMGDAAMRTGHGGWWWWWWWGGVAR